MLLGLKRGHACDQWHASRVNLFSNKSRCKSSHIDPHQNHSGSLPNGQDLGYALHGAVSTLSGGPVTPSDGIGLENREVIMRSSRSDGVLLHPARSVNMGC
jgi:hypothetical protein